MFMPKSSYYEVKTRPISKTKALNMELMERVQDEYDASRGRYGAKKF